MTEWDHFLFLRGQEFSQLTNESCDQGRNHRCQAHLNFQINHLDTKQLLEVMAFIIYLSIHAWSCGLTKEKIVVTPLRCVIYGMVIGNVTKTRNGQFAQNLWIPKIFKFLNQCFARLQFWKSVKNHQPRFCDFLHFSKTEVVQNTDLRI